MIPTKNICFQNIKIRLKSGIGVRSDFPDFRTFAASMTSTASTTSGASMTSTASFHQKNTDADGWTVKKPSFYWYVYDTLSLGGCWGQQMLLFWKLVDETQMSKPPKATRHHNSTKLLILLPRSELIYFVFFTMRHPVHINIFMSNFSPEEKVNLFVCFSLQ